MHSGGGGGSRIQQGARKTALWVGAKQSAKDARVGMGEVSPTAREGVRGPPPEKFWFWICSQSISHAI